MRDDVVGKPCGTLHKLNTPDMINECKCTTPIHYNYNLFHPEIKHIYGGVRVHHAMARRQVAKGVPTLQEEVLREEQAFLTLPTCSASPNPSCYRGVGGEGNIED